MHATTNDRHAIARQIPDNKASNTKFTHILTNSFEARYVYIIAYGLKNKQRAEFFGVGVVADLLGVKEIHIEGDSHFAVAEIEVRDKAGNIIDLSDTNAKTKLTNSTSGNQGHGCGSGDWTTGCKMLDGVSTQDWDTSRDITDQSKYSPYPKFEAVSEELQPNKIMIQTNDSKYPNGIDLGSIRIYDYRYHWRYSRLCGQTYRSAHSTRL